jgi:seryl-tRNA synthetase
VLDLRQIREDPEPARAALARRGVDSAALDRALELDDRRRALLPELEELRRRKNEASKRIGELQRAGGDASEAIAEVRGVSAREKELDDELRSVEERRSAALAMLPNLPDESAPLEDEVLREEGEAGGRGRNHVELLGSYLDLESAARVAGRASPT